jgi:hypothetical protein
MKKYQTLQGFMALLLFSLISFIPLSGQNNCDVTALTCVDAFTVNLFPTAPSTDADGDGDFDLGANFITATALLTGSFTDCTNPIEYALHLEGTLPVPGVDTLVVTCDSPQDMIVQVTAFDDSGGATVTGSCLINLTVSDDLFCICSDCGTSGSIAGVIETEYSDAINNVALILNGDLVDTLYTVADGGYIFPNVPIGSDLKITPYKNDSFADGVSTFDLVLIIKHILGVTPFNSPYKRIAADINNSGDITIADLLALQAFILSLTDEFEDNTSWRFIRSDYIFPDPANPWIEPFPEQIIINNYQEEDILFGDFVGVKIGDVSGDAQGN